jgi:hypothetical protein
MQTPAIVELNWRQGRSNNTPFALYEDAAHLTPIDITGVRWILEVRSGSADSSGTLLLRKDSDVSGEVTRVDASGEFTFNIPPSATTGQSWREAQYEVIGVWPGGSGETLTYFVGKVTLSEAAANVSAS